jgi:hypothetical protein
MSESSLKMSETLRSVDHHLTSEGSSEAAYIGSYPLSNRSILLDCAFGLECTAPLDAAVQAPEMATCATPHEPVGTKKDLTWYGSVGLDGV